MNNMKRLAAAVAFLFIATTIIGCGKNSLQPENNNPMPGAGVYFIPATTEHAPQVMISTGEEIRLGTESKNLSIESFKVLNSDSVSVSIKNISGGTFSAKAYKLPLTTEDYSASNANHPFCGLYASANPFYIFAIKENTAIQLCHRYSDTYDIIGIQRENLDISFSDSANLTAENNGNDIKWRGTRWFFKLEQANLAPYEGGIIQTSEPAAGSATPTFNLVGLDGLGR